MSSSEKIAHAYGVLVARGDKVTVRAVQNRRGCGSARWRRGCASTPRAQQARVPRPRTCRSRCRRWWPRCGRRRGSAPPSRQTRPLRWRSMPPAPARPMPSLRRSPPRRSEQTPTRPGVRRSGTRSSCGPSWPRFASSSMRRSVRQSMRASRPRRPTVPGAGRGHFGHLA